MMRRVNTLVVAAAALLAAASASAHDLSPKPERELVRIQGYRSPAPAGNQVDRELKLVVEPGGAVLTRKHIAQIRAELPDCCADVPIIPIKTS